MQHGWKAAAVDWFVRPVQQFAVDMGDSGRVYPGRLLVRPEWWVCCALLLLNDHFLKGLLDAPLLTGKLSDFLGLFVAPAALAFALRLRTRRGLSLLHVALGVVFTSINSVPQAAQLWTQVGAWLGLQWRVWCDPWDLVALPMLALSWQVIVRSEQSAARKHWVGSVRAAGAAVGVLACLASSVAPPNAPHMTWGNILIHDRGNEQIHVFRRPGGGYQSSLPTELDPVITPHVVATYSQDQVRGFKPANTELVRWSFSMQDVDSLSACGDDVFVVLEERTILLNGVSGKARYTLPYAIDRVHCQGDLLIRALPSGSKQGGLVATDRMSRKEIWRSSGPVAREAELLPLGEDMLLVAASPASAFNAKTGELRWTTKLPGRYVNRWALTAGTAVAEVDDCCSVGIWLSGEIGWRGPARPLLGAGGELAIFWEEGHVLALKAASGELLWRTPIVDLPPHVSAVVDEALVVVRADVTKIVALNAETGEIVWRSTVPGQSR